MLEFADSDSEDEKLTTITRSDDQDSRAVSEAAATPAHVGDDETPTKKRRKLDSGWAATAVESDDEIDAHSKTLLGHLLGKEPEDMALRELEQVISTLPRHTRLRKRALAEVKLRKKAEEDDALFFGITKLKVPDAAAAPDVVMEDDASIATPEPEVPIKAAKKKGTAKPVKKGAKLLTQRKDTAKPAEAKPKKKTKKQLLEEQETAREEAKAKENLLVAIEKEEAPTPEIIERQEQEEPRAEVEWSVSTERPRRTVEDDPELVLDIDGWQHLVKDDEDLKFLTDALKSQTASTLGDIKLWAWNQKEIKGKSPPKPPKKSLIVILKLKRPLALNNGGVHGPVTKPTTIEGYYVPNSSGAARTEGVQKILNSEKSKYLPHHIRVRKQREEREARAKKDPSAAAAPEPAKAKMASVQTSRSARVQNRRLVNEIATQKQTLGLDAEAISFNQLKKRKKLVRFDRSAIHNWGLYADENIAAGEMIIEYVGELVRQRVADLREVRYQQQGIGSSYLFRIDEDLVVDATKKGGIARFINHSCAPSCTAKIIKVEGTKRIVIYALRDIAKSKSTFLFSFPPDVWRMLC
jgi:histone-lysine N-methyltransferase SETD1